MTQQRFDARCWVLLVMVCGLAAAAGCGGSAGAEVSGKVTLNGAPLADGDISFYPEQGEGSQSSAPIKNGEYRIGGEFGLAPGTYQARINAYREPTDKSNMLAGGALDKPPETPGVPAREQFLPEKFNTKSTLEKLTVEAGQGKVEKNYDIQYETAK